MPAFFSQEITKDRVPLQGKIFGRLGQNLTSSLLTPWARIWRIIRMAGTMNRSSRVKQSPTRRLAALASLLALLLTYAQMASATLMAVSGACCTGDQCPIHGNHHSAQNKPAQKTENAPMDCGHERHEASRLQTYSVSCCNTVELTATHANLYLFTSPVPATSLTAVAPTSLVPAIRSLSPAFPPLAPPPKSLVT
jgi:hypothetical protein